MENSANDVNDIKPITGLYNLKVAQDWLKKYRKNEKKLYYSFQGSFGKDLFILIIKINGILTSILDVS